MNILEDIIINIAYLNHEKAILKEKDALHIGFGIDASYVLGMGVLIQSILCYNPDEKIVFHIFTDGLDQEDIERLKEFSRNEKIQIIIYMIDIDKIKQLPTTQVYSLAIYYRLILGKALHGVVERVLYLDVDIICLASIRPIFEIDLDGTVAAVVRDRFGNDDDTIERLNLTNHILFNSGVLLIDLNRWNHEHIAENALQLLREHAEMYRCYDQDVLNLLLKGKTKLIDKKWNYMYNISYMNYLLPENIVFVHFIGEKPWKDWMGHHRMAAFFEKYKEKSPWHGVPFVKPQSYKENRKMARSCFRRRKYMHAFGWYIKYLFKRCKEKM